MQELAAEEQWEERQSPGKETNPRTERLQPKLKDGEWEIQTLAAENSEQ